MAHVNYGTVNDHPSEIVFGGARPRQQSTAKMDFKQLSEAIASNIFTIQSGGSNLEKAIKSLGSKRDNQGLRDHVHVIQMSTNQIVTQTSQDLMQLTSLARRIGDRMFFLQVERLKSEFEHSLKRYSELQKDVVKKMKAVVPYSNWENDNATSQDRQALLEKAAEEQYEKRQLLKQVEFEQDMLLEREQRIRQIESDIIDVNQIMKELSAMVQEQGENINSIESNIDRTYTHVEEGRQQLEKASSLQRTHRKWLCFLAIIGMLVAAVVALILYLELRPS